MNLENLLKITIEKYENDIQCGLEGKERENVAKVVSELIIKLTRLLHNFRYCSKKECSCSPESMIKDLIEKHEEIYKKHLGKEYIQKILEYVGG